MKSILVLILAIVVTIVGGSYWWYREVSFREKYEISQMACLTSILLNDTKGESDESRGQAQELIADSVIRYRRSKTSLINQGEGSLGFCDIHSGGLTLYPDNWDKASTFTGRSSFLTGLNPFNWSTTWTEAENRARHAIEHGPMPERCATHYIRAKPGYSYFTNEKEAQLEVAKRMKREKTPSNLKVQFYCP
jgi:hypothetical protein